MSMKVSALFLDWFILLLIGFEFEYMGVTIKSVQIGARLGAIMDHTRDFDMRQMFFSVAFLHTQSILTHKR